MGGGGEVVVVACVCVCVCGCVCVRVCVCMWVRVTAACVCVLWLCVCVCVCLCVFECVPCRVFRFSERTQRQICGGWKGKRQASRRRGLLDTKSIKTLIRRGLGCGDVEHCARSEAIGFF